MDIISKKPMAYQELARLISGKRLIAGAKQLRKALLSGAAQGVLLACDADPAITQPIASACEQKDIAPVWVRTMADIGRACGIDVGAAAAAIVDIC